MKEKMAVAVENLERTKLTFYYDDKNHSSEGFVYEVGDGTIPYWSENENLINVLFDESFKDYINLESTSEWFLDCENLRHITNMKYLNTSNVKDMSWMFRGCHNLMNQDFSTYKTDNVINMEGMFWRCRKIEYLDLSGWETSNVFYIRSIFADCYKLKAIEGVKNFTTSKVEDMSQMFSGCTSLTTLDLSNWNTSKVTSMSSMFDGCFELESLDLSGWDTSSVTNMYKMFVECERLKSLNLDSWNTSNIKDMSYMFAGCENYKELEQLITNTNKSQNNT